jgi:N-acetylmuramic acid 6-phosphate etherase
MNLDRLTADEIVNVMLAEDRRMLAAVLKEKSRIATGVEFVASALRKGGRVLFVGAGTSGRLGVLESAEMPPTFSTDPALVQAIIAGGKEAFFSTKEGAEDNYEDGARTLSRLVSRHDVVIGISASGMTPFVLGALTAARKAKARVIFVTCDPASELQMFVDLTIAPAVGPEVIAGSTRLKAATATKLVLNMLTTAAMVRTGKTYGNLMVDLQPTSEKHKERAARIVHIATGLDIEESERLLRRAGWHVKAAIVMERTGLTYQKALVRLRKMHDSIRAAVGGDIEARVAKELDRSTPLRPKRRRLAHSD